MATRSLPWSQSQAPIPCQVSWVMRKVPQIPNMGHFFTKAFTFEKNKTKLTNTYKRWNNIKPPGQKEFMRTAKHGVESRLGRTPGAWLMCCLPPQPACPLSSPTPRASFRRWICIYIWCIPQDTEDCPAARRSLSDSPVRQWVLEAEEPLPGSLSHRSYLPNSHLLL